MKKTRSPRHIYLSKEIYEAFARAVKAQGKVICTVLEEYMDAYAHAYNADGPKESIQFIEPPAIPRIKAPTSAEFQQAQENLKNTMLEHMDIIKCLHCGEVKPISKQGKKYIEREGIRPRCEVCKNFAEVVERCPSP